MAIAFSRFSGAGPRLVGLGVLGASVLSLASISNGGRSGMGEAFGADRAEDVIVGEGEYRYRWVPDWPKLPQGLGFGNTHGCMVVADDGRIFVNTDSENAVMIFQPDGSYVGGWGKEFAGGLHGMTISEEGGSQFLYLTHLGRHQVIKTTLDGVVLWTLDYPEESGKYQSADQYRPTAVAVAPNGDFYVADGYGQNWIHQYDWKGTYRRSFGGPGNGAGQFQTCHGLWMDVRGDAPMLIVADRENHRVQTLTLDGEPIAQYPADLRRPCSFYEHGGDLAVADLAGRVSILGPDYQVRAQLGDQPEPSLRARNDVDRDQWQDGVFVSPHSAAFGSNGDLYVMDWLRLGRVSKLERLR